VITFLLVAGLVCFVVEFVLTAFAVAKPRLNLIALGLACWILTSLIGAWPK
jgi:hypothetical protein